MPLEYYVILEYHEIEEKTLLDSSMRNHASSSVFMGIKKQQMLKTNVSERI